MWTSVAVTGNDGVFGEAMYDLCSQFLLTLTQVSKGPDHTNSTDINNTSMECGKPSRPNQVSSHPTQTRPSRFCIHTGLPCLHNVVLNFNRSPVMNCLYTAISFKCRQYRTPSRLLPATATLHITTAIVKVDTPVIWVQFWIVSPALLIPNNICIVLFSRVSVTISVLMLLSGWQEGHLVCKNLLLHADWA